MLAAISVVVFCCAASAQEATGRVHAVIINGGMNKLMNHERYWNDCAFLYRTLREDLHFPKQDITLLMSDGGDPGRDMLLADGSGFASSSADLDNDGERDVWLPATLAQVEASLTELAARLASKGRRSALCHPFGPVARSLSCGIDVLVPGIVSFWRLH